jgi:Kef-type K+ transport system membrane component KefB
VPLSFDSFAIVAIIGFVAPFLAGLVPRLHVPAVVLEIAAGVIVGPQVLGWVTADAPVQVFADVGLAALLFLAGLEIRLERMRGAAVWLACAGFAVSFGLAVGGAEVMRVAGLTTQTLLVAIALAATSLGIVVIPLRETGETGSQFGQLVIAAASVAEVGTIVMLSLFFSQKREGPGTDVLHLALFAAVALVLTASALRLRHERWARRVGAVVGRLEDTTSRLRVRADIALLALAVWLGDQLGLEAILAAFTAGLIRGAIAERDEQAEERLATIAFGVFVPFFFVTSGVQLDIDAVGRSASTLASVFVFLLLILAVRGLPALLYARRLTPDRVAAAGLLQATTLPFVVVATSLGTRLGLLDSGTAAAFVMAAVLSVLLFPTGAVEILRRGAPAGVSLEEEAF